MDKGLCYLGGGYGEGVGVKPYFFIRGTRPPFKMKKNVRNAQDALGLFQFGYRDIIIAARTELTESFVAKLRKHWLECHCSEEEQK